jgi:PKD repeat protein
MQSFAPATLAAALICAFAPSAVAAPQPGLDCGCSTVGDYVLPTAAVARASANAVTGLSPGLKYHVTAVPGQVQAASITVKRVSDGAVLLHDIEAADWGFSPDDDRFVLATISVGGGPAMATLYDLTAVPAAQLHQFTLAAAGSAISFSPNGVYLTDAELEPTPMSVALLVLDARTGAQVFTDSFNFTSPPGTPDDELGAVAIGFGPDATDRTLTYVYVTGPTATQWTTVNLAHQPSGLRVLNLQPGPAFTWGFSPCGDAIGIIADHEPDALKDADVYATLLGTHLGGFGPFPATETAALSVTAASHLVTHNAVPDVIAPNTAGATCPSPPPNNPPTAAFSAPATSLAMLPVQFTDQSTDSDGHVVGFHWDFGDGQTSSLRSPSHVFASTGTFSVALTVTDDRSATGTVSHSITVSANQPPQVTLSFAPPTPAARDVVTLTDQSTDDDGIVQQDWVIDGVPYSGAVVHARACPPSMALTLTVYDHAGQSGSIQQVIAVTGGSADVPVAAGANLAAAIAGVCPADRLVLATGHYAGGVSLPSQISMRGAGMGATFIDGSSGDPDKWALQLSTDLTVSDLTVSGGGVDDHDQFLAGGGIRFRYGQDPLQAHLSRVEVTGNRGNGGVTIDDQVRAVDISGSRIHHNQRDVTAEGGSAISMFCCASATVDQTEIASNTTVGHSGAAFIWEADGVVFTRNDVHDNDGPGLEAQVNCCSQQGDVRLNRIASNGAGAVTEGKIVFAGNLVVKNTGNGLEDGLAHNLTVVNSTIADNGGIGLFAAGATVWNTIVAGNGTDVSGAIGGGGTNLIGGAPGFVGSGDYHLAAGSPVIDTGTNSAVPVSLVIDGDGDPRVLNAGSGAATVDIGWDEATSGWPVPVADAGVDAGNPDAGAPDAGALDAGASDAGALDAGVPDAGAPDAGVDAGTVGGSGSTSTSGCGCRTSQAAGDLFAWVGAMACFWARRMRARVHVT